MTIVIPVAITPALLPLPNPADRATFSERKLEQLRWANNEYSTGSKALADASYSNAQDAQDSATAAAGSALSAITNAALAAGYAGVGIWVTLTTYVIGDRRYSPINGRIYRRLTAGAGATDPSADPTNWQLDAATALLLIPVAGTTQAAASGGNYSLGNVAATVVTAPVAATPGDRFAVSNCNGLETNSINWNGLKHEGISDSTTLLDDTKYHEFEYISAGFGWKVKV